MKYTFLICILLMTASFSFAQTNEEKEIEKEMELLQKEIEEEVEKELEQTREELEALQREQEIEMEKTLEQLEELNELERLEHEEKAKDRDIEIHIGKRRHEGHHHHHRDTSNVKTRWVMMDIGMTTWLADGKFNIPSELDAFELNYGRSSNINLHLYKQRINILKHKLHVVHGLSFEHYRYSFTNATTLSPGEAVLNYSIDDSKDFKQNRLQTSFLSLPLMLNLETKPFKSYKSFHFSAGGYAGVMLGSSQRQKTKIDGKQVIRDDFNMNKFRYGLIGQIGYGYINVYVNYSLTPLFKETQGPIGGELTPLSIGFVVIPF